MDGTMFKKSRLFLVIVLASVVYFACSQVYSWPWSPVSVSRITYQSDKDPEFIRKNPEYISSSDIQEPEYIRLSDNQIVFSGDAVEISERSGNSWSTPILQPDFLPRGLSRIAKTDRAGALTPDPSDPQVLLDVSYGIVNILEKNNGTWATIGELNSEDCPSEVPLLNRFRGKDVIIGNCEKIFFGRKNTDGKWIETGKFTLGDPVIGVAISNQYAIAVTLPKNPYTDVYAHIYEKQTTNGENWLEILKMDEEHVYEKNADNVWISKEQENPAFSFSHVPTPQLEGRESQSGISLDITGHCIGAYGELTRYITLYCKGSHGKWEYQNLEIPDKYKGDFYGSYLAMTDNRIVVSEYFQSGVVFRHPPKVLVYEKNSSGAWEFKENYPNFGKYVRGDGYIRGIHLSEDELLIAGRKDVYIIHFKKNPEVQASSSQQ
jgi:hypothetical protein